MSSCLSFKFLNQFGFIQNHFKIKDIPPPPHFLWEFCVLTSFPDLSQVASLKQEHGNQIWSISNWEEASKFCNPQQQIAGDGLITNLAGLTLRIKVADCLPIYLVDPRNRVISLIHAGREGLRKGIVQTCLKKLTHLWNSSPKDIYCLIGPGINSENYHVNRQIAEQFPSHLSQNIDGLQYRLDIKKYALSLLIAGGIAPEHIIIIPLDTYTEPFLESYRRDKQHADRMEAFLLIR
ncbi:polyphenol oxidase family protein [bacterium]|nr:polyphenol oxidase family protein [bacterium]